MSKLVIFGATGQQGFSILNTVASHSALSKKYSLRAVTRDLSKPRPQSLLARGIETVQADLDDVSTLPAAVQDAHTVVLITETQYIPDLKERETTQAKNVADAAIKAGVQFFIFSTAVHASSLWDGGPVDQFDVKAEIESYLRTLPFKLGTAFIAPGMFMQNLTTVMGPHKQDDGSYAVFGVNEPQTKIPLIDTPGDTGAYLVPVLDDPERFNGKVVYASSGLWSFAQMVDIISNVSGERVVYKQLPDDVFAGFMPADMGRRIVRMMKFIDAPGYYGQDTEGRVNDAIELVQQSGGRLASFEGFAERTFKTL
ncbi:hypothetical protein BDV18DRAFT_162816 [Aspergillus unguis]